MEILLLESKIIIYS